MRRLTVLLILPALLLARAASAEDNPDFPQIHPQPNTSQGASAYQPNPAFGVQNQAGIVNPNQGPSPNGSQIGGETHTGPSGPAGTASPSGVTRGKAGALLHNDIAVETPPTAPDTPDPVPGPMSAEDALANFTTVVETYVANKSPKGYWLYTEKAAGKKPVAWRLTEPKVSDDGVKKLTGEKYSGRVKLRDVRGGHPPPLDFVVDFAGVEWKVVAISPAAKPR